MTDTEQIRRYVQWRDITTLVMFVIGLGIVVCCQPSKGEFTSLR